MRIAAVTDDGVNISQHFGRAPFYVVLTIEDRKIKERETRPKASHHSLHHADREHGRHGHGHHGCDHASHPRHAAMAAAIADCQVLLAGGMGLGAYENLKSYGIHPVLTDVTNIDEAVKRYLEGNLPNLMERLH